LKYFLTVIDVKATIKRGLRFQEQKFDWERRDFIEEEG
jgi:hypothetical protein